MSDAKTAIIVETQLPYPPETIWRLLTESDLIARWLMPNDFKPVLGHRFNFRTKPMGDWDGVVDCEVLEIAPPHRLRYSWKGGASSNAAYGSRLDTIVLWTLTETPGGTRLRMEHAGFRPENAFAYDMMSPGWGRILERIGQLIGEGA